MSETGAAGAVYTLCFENNYRDGEYYLFMQPPQTTPDVTEVFTNTWCKFSLERLGLLNIQITLGFYAWCGVSPVDNPTTGAIISGGMSEPVDLGGKNGTPGTTWATRIIGPAMPEFVPAPPSGSPGCYAIKMGTEFTAVDNYMIGVALPDPTSEAGLSVPVATQMAAPNLTTNIAPIHKFYIAYGKSVQGQIIDYQSVSTDAGCWDFSPDGRGAGMFYGKLTQGPDGVFMPAIYQPKAPQP